MAFHIASGRSLMEKLNILSDAAKYDVACTSSGSSRRGDGKGIGNTCLLYTSLWREQLSM